MLGIHSVVTSTSPNLRYPRSTALLVDGQNGLVSTARRPPRGIRGLMGAMVATVVLVLAIWVVSRPQKEDLPAAAPAIDYSAQLDTARSQAPFDVLAPESLPDGWRATSAQWRGSEPAVTWHLGVLTDDDTYVGLEQSNAGASSFIEDSTRADEPRGPVRIDGRTWQTFESGTETAFVLVEEDVTTVVTGTATRGDLVTFTESLTAR